MYRLFSASVAVCLIMTGCFALGPDYQRPDVVSDLPAQYREAEDVDIRQYIVDDWWWAEFDDARLNKVVANVITHNPDIQKAAKDFDIEILGKIPIDTKISEMGDKGLSFIDNFSDSISGKEMKKIVSRIIEKL